MLSKAKTVAEYLASLPPDRREAIRAVRDLILANLDEDYEETMQYGMIGYAVPHRVFPEGYHCDPKQPLPFAALASQKNYMSIYLMGVYMERNNEDASWFRDAWKAAGKKIDMGKCCVRFKKLDDLALDVLAEAIRRMPARRYVEAYLRARAEQGGRSNAGKAATKARAAASRKPVAQRRTNKPKAAAKARARKPERKSARSR
ncbi:MAG TPA: DUF1801 domain-containing protein [Planctomycetota bacterium]|nr:DUF1801 domain-containing protein [Planctomycetota bacterium]